jgi:hypothetical protein
MGIVEAEPEIFYIATSEIYTWVASDLYRLNLNGWALGKPVHPEAILHFPQPVRGLNGSCVIARGRHSDRRLFWKLDLACGSQRARWQAESQRMAQA